MEIQSIKINISRPEKYPAKQHAQAAAAKLGVNDGLIYLLGQYAFTIEDSDASKTWRQRRYFYYLSGVDESNCCLTYDIRTTNLTLYIPEIHPERVVWTGRGSTIDEAEERYDVDQAKHNSSLFHDLKTWAKHNNEAPFYILHEDHKPKIKLHNVNSDKLKHAIDLCRVIKDDYEIKCLRKANEISAKAHVAVLENIYRFSNEAEIKGIFHNVCIKNFAKQAYPVIAGSGENAGVLHYMEDNEPLKGRQLVCLDAGAQCDLYASDVTRTFPISGEWPSEEAKNIYKVVEEMQETCIKTLAPGVKMYDLHVLAHKIAIKGLLALGVLQNGSVDEIYEAGTSKGFYPHGLGHHLGLETHDVLDVPIMRYRSQDSSSSMHASMWTVPPAPEAAYEQPKLEPGMVITVEPGIYFSRYELKRAYLNSEKHSKYINKEVLESYWAVGGVRIEDDLLITTDGYENITTAPKGEKALDIIRKGYKSGNHQC